MSNDKIAIVKAGSYESEEVKDALTRLFRDLGMDAENPFRDIIRPGMKVFIKPNFVASRWRESCSHKGDIYSVITHPSVIEAVCDKVALALGTSGEITVGDNPSIDADFDELMNLTGLKRLENKYKVPCKVIDLRPLVCDNLEYYGKRDKMKKRAGDPCGETTVNLKNSSALFGIDPLLFRGVFDEREETIASHEKDTQLYTFSNSIYNSDVYISIPKLKTHHKSGVTINLKGLVGTIARKNQLVHWRVGYPLKGGDEYPSENDYKIGMEAKVKSRGAWPGNDTIWRMVVDIYNAIITRKRAYFTIVDGITGGEGEGPFCPAAKHSHVLLGGSDLITMDIVATRLMGIDPKKITYLNYFIAKKSIELAKINVFIDGQRQADYFDSKDAYLDFKLLDKWSGIKIKK